MEGWLAAGHTLASVSDPVRNDGEAGPFLTAVRHPTMMNGDDDHDDHGDGAGGKKEEEEGETRPVHIPRLDWCEALSAGHVRDFQCEILSGGVWVGIFTCAYIYICGEREYMNDAPCIATTSGRTMSVHWFMHAAYAFSILSPLVFFFFFSGKGKKKKEQTPKMREKEKIKTDIVKGPA